MVVPALVDSADWADRYRAELVGASHASAHCFGCIGSDCMVDVVSCLRARNGSPGRSLKASEPWLSTVHLLMD